MSFQLETPYPLNKNVIIHFFADIFPEDRNDIVKLNAIRNESSWNKRSEVLKFDELHERLDLWMKLWHRLYRKCINRPTLTTPYITKFTWHAGTFNLGAVVFSLKKYTSSLSGETTMLAYHCVTTFYNQAITYIDGLHDSEKTLIDNYCNPMFIVKIPKMHGLVLFKELTKKKNLLGNHTVFTKSILELLAKSYWTMYCIMYEPSIVIHDQIRSKGLLPFSENTFWHDYTIYAGIPLLLFQKVFTTSFLIRQSSDFLFQTDYKNTSFEKLMFCNELWTIRELVNITFVIELKLDTESIRNRSKYLDIDTDEKEIKDKMDHLKKMKTSLDYSLRIHLCFATYFCVSLMRIHHTKKLAEIPELVINLYFLIEKIHNYIIKYMNPLEIDIQLKQNNIDILDYYIAKLMYRRIHIQLNDLKIMKPRAKTSNNDKDEVDYWIEEIDIESKPYKYYDSLVKLYRKWLPFCRPEFTHEKYSRDIMQRMRDHVLENLFQ